MLQMTVKKEVAEGEAERVERPIAKHHPIAKCVSPQKTTISSVMIPDLAPPQELDTEGEFEDWALNVYEWLSLVGIQSPRVQAGDAIDPYLSRYTLQLPQGDSPKPQNLARITWFGLLPKESIRKLFIDFW